MNDIHERPELQLFFDGACEPVNPGGVATYGWIILDRGEVLADGCGVHCEGPRATNNVAEYVALGFGLRRLQDLGWGGRLSVYGDSQLVIKQLAGEWACNKPHLRKLRDRCLDILHGICPGKSYTLTWVPREENAAADALSRRAYEKHTGKPFHERRARSHG
jgi:ribonuclease HI